MKKMGEKMKQRKQKETLTQIFLGLRFLWVSGFFQIYTSDFGNWREKKEEEEEELSRGAEKETGTDKRVKWRVGPLYNLSCP